MTLQEEGKETARSYLSDINKTLFGLTPNFYKQIFVPECLNLLHLPQHKHHVHYISQFRNLLKKRETKINAVMINLQSAYFVDIRHLHTQGNIDKNPTQRQVTGKVTE
jgi:hypothetical protein